jgi:predicted dehydrogenase
VVGYGYWGPNLVRNFMETAGASVRYVIDQSEERLAPVRVRYPSIRTTTSLDEALRDEAVGAVAVATPVSTHFGLAMAALEAGKHVLVEKPMAATADEARRLERAAERRGLLLMVDHSFPYTGAVERIKQLVDAGELGEVYYYDSVRVNLGLFQHDVNVIWDLAVHDLAILEYVLGRFPVAVSATGISHVSGQPENIAYVTLFYEDKLIAHIHVNWLAPVKLRTTLIGGSRKMVLYNDLEPTEKVRVYDKGVVLQDDPNEVYQMRIGYRSGDIWVPHLDGTEALRRLAAHFVACVEGTETPRTSARSGRRVVQIMEAATESLHDQGRLVAVDRLMEPA